MPRSWRWSLVIAAWLGQPCSMKRVERGISRHESGLAAHGHQKQGRNPYRPSLITVPVELRTWHHTAGHRDIDQMQDAFYSRAKADEPRRCTGCRHTAGPAARVCRPDTAKAGRRFDEREPGDHGTADTGTGGGIRRDRGGRGLLRPVHAAFAARAGAVRPGVRTGRRRRRHLVLESLPGRPLRQRERLLHVQRPHVRGDPRRMELVGTLRRPAGDPPLPGIRHGQDGPAPGHPVQRAGGLRGIRPGTQSLGRQAGGRRRGVGTVPDHRGGLPVLDEHPEVPGHRHLRRRELSHRRLAARRR